ncbi:MAG: hypothetical protein AAF627_20650, partial [Myxococcota bacterium]
MGEQALPAGVKARTSKHVALLFGDSGIDSSAMDEAMVLKMLNFSEYLYHFYIHRVGREMTTLANHPELGFGESYKLNVYVGGTGLPGFEQSAQLAAFICDGCPAGIHYHTMPFDVDFGMAHEFGHLAWDWSSGVGRNEPVNFGWISENEANWFAVRALRDFHGGLIYRHLHMEPSHLAHN